MKSLLFILLTIVLLSSNCKKDHLPTFYFQCKVDGVFYEPDNCANCKTTELFGDSTILFGMNVSNGGIGIAIRKQNLNQGNYNFSKLLLENNATGSYDNTIGNPSDIFRTDSIRTGIINIIELDKTNKIIVGSFAFDAFNIQQNKIVKITQGKFRLKYRIY